MLRKEPKSGLLQFFKTGTKTLLIIEGISLLASYAVWRRMNTSQDFRFYMYQKFPSVLEGYYSLGEQLSGDNSMRTADLKLWTQLIDNE